MSSVYGEAIHLIAKEAKTMMDSGMVPSGTSIGGAAAAVMSTLLGAFASEYGPGCEKVIDIIAADAKTVAVAMREAETCEQEEPEDDEKKPDQHTA